MDDPQPAARAAAAAAPPGLPLLLVLAACGGALGGGAREAVAQLLGGPLAGTLAVNAVGSLLLGVLLARGPGPRWRAFAGTGLLGGFTTWSSLALETDRLLPGGPAAGAAWLLANLVAGLVLAALGLRLGARTTRSGR